MEAGEKRSVAIRSYGRRNWVEGHIIRRFHEESELQPKVPQFYTRVQIAIRFVCFIFCAKSILGYESSILLLLHSIVLEIHFLFPVHPAFSNISIAVVNKHGWARIFVSLSFATETLSLIEQHLENGDAATGLLLFAHHSLFFLGFIHTRISNWAL
jgi:hypothetical protein